MTDNRITPETAPVGARILIKHVYGPDPFEVTVLQWLPDGETVQLLWHYNGRSNWKSASRQNWTLIHVLSNGAVASFDTAAPTVETRLAASLDNLDARAAAVVGVWVERGGDAEC